MLPEPAPAATVLTHAVADALGIAPAALLSPAPQGMTSEVAFVLDGTRESVLKRCRHPVYVAWLRRERRVLRALSEAPWPMPRVIGSHESGANEVWLHMTRVPGESLWQVLLRSPLERGAHLRTLGRLLRQLHSLPAPSSFRGQRPWLDRTLAQARLNLAWCDGSAALLDRLEATRPADGPEVLIHGDLALDNVLVDSAGHMGLIDWSGGDLGDPRYDVSLALATEPELRLDPPEVDAFYDGYGDPPLEPAVTRWFVELYEFF
jgi:aminoglycoside phosphotransferase (APT) family kinase protein